MATVISLVSIVLLTVADQLIKLVVEAKLEPVGVKSFIDGFIGWRYVRNTGAAFGSFSENTAFLTVFTAIILIAGIAAICLKKIKPGFCLACAVIIISGGLGNLADRIARGYVVDYIEVQFMDFAVFNFADILVTVGAFMLMGYLIYDIARDAKKKKTAGKASGKKDTNEGSEES